MTPQQKLIARLCAVFGEPRSEDVDVFVKELERSLKPFAADVLQQTCDEVIDSSQFWPRPYEIRCIATRIGTDKAKAKIKAATVPVDIPPPPTAEQRQRADAMVKEMRKAIAVCDVTEDIKPQPDMTRPGFEAMQRKSRNTWLHQKRGGDA